VSTHQGKKNKLGVYLLKEEQSGAPEQIFRKPNELKHEELTVGKSRVGDLYFGRCEVYEPKWVKSFFGSSFNNRQSEQGEAGKFKLFTASPRVVVLIPVEVETKVTRTFALAFGYGWNMLDPASYEESFGLRTCLNIIKSDGLRRIDKKNMTSVPKDTSEQLSLVGGIADFGIDIEQDLLQAIVAEVQDESFGKWATGRDALSVTPPVDLGGITEFLKASYEKYMSQEYKKDFSWVDQVHMVKDKEVIGELDDRLITKLIDRDLDKTWMAVPELIEWSDVAGFSFTPKGDSTDDLDLTAFLDFIKNKQSAALSRRTLNRDVFCRSSNSDQPKYLWKAYKCLYCEVSDSDKGKTYLLNNGLWFEVENQFSDSVETEYQRLLDGTSPYSFPTCHAKDEAGYLEEVERGAPGTYCTHKKSSVYVRGKGQVEFADLFTGNKEIIHVKRYGQSRYLSHLFSQGIVSGELWVTDHEFRQEVNKVLPEELKLADPQSKPNASDYTIIYAIISTKPDRLNIPFFSKVNVNSAKKRLEGFGYQVCLQKIDSAARPNAIYT
jgi:uncharacterized protein (TIGR04141 family)